MAKAENRLHDIVVEEVSLVDRAANKRKFLIIKRSDPMQNGAELQPDGAGGFLAAPEQIPATPAEEVQQEPESETVQDVVSNPEPEPTQDVQQPVDDVEKRGAPMSKQRFARFAQAVQLLTDILQELSPAAMEPPAEPEPMEDRAKAADVEKKEEPAAEPVEKPNAVQEKLVETVKRLVAVASQQQQEIATLRKSRVVTNSIPVEGQQPKQITDVKWDLDVNAKSISDDVSFLDV